MDHRGNIVRKFDGFIWLIVMLILIGTAIIYPLGLGELAPYFTKFPWQNSVSWKETIFRAEFLPWLTSGISPLVAKETWFLWGSAILGGAAMARWIFRSLGGLETSLLTPGGSLIRRIASTPEVWFLVFLVYAGFGVAHSEVFFSGIYTWTCMALGGLLVIVLRTARFSTARVVQFMAVVVCIGIVLALVALLQDLSVPTYLPVFSDPRNRMGSLIGHNTGLSSWLMFPIAFSIYFVLTNRKYWVKIVAAVAALLMIFVIVAAQSRAIWFLGLLLCITTPRAICRSQRRPFPFTYLLLFVVAVAGVVAAQTWNPRENPLASAPVTLGERVDHDILNLDQLRRETRVRIAVVTTTQVIPAHPFLGSGVGSFSWVYPRAQGHYFKDHPDTWLGTTLKRTDLAHDDWLQLLAETGIAGFLLLAGALVSAGRQALSKYRRENDPGTRAVLVSLAIPLIALALHAFVDFPFHVAPLAVVGLISFGILTSPSLYISEDQDRPGKQFHLRRDIAIAFIGSLALLCWMPFVFWSIAAKPFASDAFYSSGLSWLDAYYASEQGDDKSRLQYLDAARSQFREAVVSNVFNGAAYEGQAIAYVNMTSILSDKLARLKQPGERTTGTLELTRNAIESDAKAAISALNNQMSGGELRYHYTFYLLGKAYRALWLLNPDPSDEKQKMYRDNAMKAFELAIDYNPADSTAMFELSELLQGTSGGAERARQLREKMLSIDPWTSRRLLLDPAVYQAQIGRIGNAELQLNPIMHDNPRDSTVNFAYAKFLFYKAVWPPPVLDKIGAENDALGYRKSVLEAGEASLNIAGHDPAFATELPRWKMLYAAAEGKYQEALTLAETSLAKSPKDSEAISVEYWCQKRVYGGPLKFVDSLDYYRTHALLAIYFMDDRKTAGINLGELSFRDSLTLPEATRLIAFYKANDYDALIKMVMPNIIKVFPDVPEFQ